MTAACPPALSGTSPSCSACTCCAGALPSSVPAPPTSHSLIWNDDVSTLRHHPGTMTLSSSSSSWQLWWYSCPPVHSFHHERNPGASFVSLDRAKHRYASARFHYASSIPPVHSFCRTTGSREWSRYLPPRDACCCCCSPSCMMLPLDPPRSAVNMFAAGNRPTPQLARTRCRRRRRHRLRRLPGGRCPFFSCCTPRMRFIIRTGGGTSDAPTVCTPRSSNEDPDCLHQRYNNHLHSVVSDVVRTTVVRAAYPID